MQIRSRVGILTEFPGLYIRLSAWGRLRNFAYKVSRPRIEVNYEDGERVSKRPTYEFQLEAFCDAVLRGAPTLTPPSDAVANMRVIDAIYRAAGMHPRQPSA